MVSTVTKIKKAGIENSLTFPVLRSVIQDLREEFGTLPRTFKEKWKFYLERLERVGFSMWEARYYCRILRQRNDGHILGLP